MAAVAVALALYCSGLIAAAQEIQFDTGKPGNAQHAQRVTLNSDTLIVDAGKPTWAELRFQVEPGFHINSHTPHDELLIPTSLHLAPSSSYRVLSDTYPAGLPLHLTIGAGETISTYQGEFRVQLQVIAHRGDSRLTGTLHYQACNAASCFPPRDLPVDVLLSAR